MKRLYLVIGLVVLCIGIGISENLVTKHITEKTIDSIEKVNVEVEKENFQNAEKSLNTAIKNYEKFSKNFMFCFYYYNDFDSIQQNMQYSLDTLKNGDIEWYKIYINQTKKQLNALKERELLTLKNII